MRNNSKIWFFYEKSLKNLAVNDDLGAEVHTFCTRYASLTELQNFRDGGGGRGVAPPAPDATIEVNLTKLLLLSTNDEFRKCIINILVCCQTRCLKRRDIQAVRER